jgi:hypothetical protein
LRDPSPLPEENQPILYILSGLLESLNQSVPDIVELNQDARLAPDDPALSKGKPKLLGVVEIRKLHMRSSDLPYHVRIAAGNTWQSVSLSKLKSSFRVPEKIGAGVEDLYQVYLRHYPLQSIPAEAGVGAKAVEWVWNTHKPSLRFDPRHGLFGGETGRDFFTEEKADNLPGSGHHLLTDYDLEGSCALYLHGTGDGVVIGHRETVYPNFKAMPDDMLR